MMKMKMRWQHDCIFKKIVLREIVLYINKSGALKVRAGGWWAIFQPDTY